MDAQSSGQRQEAPDYDPEKANGCFWGGVAIAFTLLGTVIVAYNSTVEAEYRTRLSEIEKKSIAALRLFETDQTQALLAALEAGQQLQTVVNENADRLSPDNLRDGKLPLEQYPTLSPITALDKILRQIQEQPIAGNPQQQLNNMAEVRWQSDGQFLAAFDDEQRVLAFWQADGTPVPVIGSPPQGSEIVWEHGRQVEVTSFLDVINIWNRGASPIAFKRTGRSMGTAIVVRWSPDGQTLAIFGKRDGFVGLWNRDESFLKIIEAYPEDVLRLAWQENSQTFVTTGSDGVIKQWQRDGSPTAMPILYQGNSKVIWGDGDPWKNEAAPAFVTIEAEGIVQLWQGGRPKATISTSHDPNTIRKSLIWSPNGEKLAILVRDGTLQIWHRDGSLLATLETNHTSESIDDRLLWSPDSEQLAILNAAAKTQPGQGEETDDVIRLWSGRGAPIKTIRQARTFSMRWSPDSEILALGSDTGSLTLWSGDDASLLKRFDKSFGTILDIGWSSDEQILLTRDRQAVRIWTRKGQLVETMSYDSSLSSYTPFRDVIWDEHQQILAFPNAFERDVMLWHQQRPAMTEFATQQPLDLGISWSPPDVSWSPDDQTLATGGADGTVKLWNPDGILLRTIDAHEKAVWSISWRSDGQILATGGADRTIKLWQPDGSLIRTINLRTGNIPIEVAWSQDNKRLIAATGRASPSTWGNRSFFSVWQTDGSLVASSFQEPLRSDATEQESQEYWQRDKELWQYFRSIKLYQPHRLNFDPTTAKVWTDDAQATATCRSLIRCDMIKFIHGDNPPINVPSAHVDLISAMVWNHAGDILATASRADGLVKLWSRNGDLIRSFQAYRYGGLERISWSSDGQTLATVNADGLIRLWPVQGLDSLLSQGCDWLNGYLIGKPDRLQDLPVCQTAERTRSAGV